MKIGFASGTSLLRSSFKNLMMALLPRLTSKRSTSISTLRLLDLYSAELGDYVRRRPLDTAGTTSLLLEGRSCGEIT
jgi:hypothetical protein